MEDYTKRSSKSINRKKYPLWFKIGSLLLVGIIFYFSIAIFLLNPEKDCENTNTGSKDEENNIPLTLPKQNIKPNENDNTDPNHGTENTDSFSESLDNSFGCQLPNRLPEESLPKKELLFKQWLKNTKIEMKNYGMLDEDLDTIFQNVKPITKIINQDANQAEYSQTFSKYLHNQITNRRIEKGKKLLSQHKQLFNQLEKKYGVSRYILVSFWAMESSFGNSMGKSHIISTLATLAHDGRRHQFFQNELRCALQIISEGHVTAKEMKSSWAGAMGQMQFMPSTFIHYSADGDGDGKKDIWGNTSDALASAANYLNKIGWDRGASWGVEVILPWNFDFYNARFLEKKSLDGWYDLDVKQTGGRYLPTGDFPGAIILPSGRRGPAFLVHHNFTIIREWNRSMFYALTVAHLSDRLAGGSTLVKKPPENERRIKRTEAISLQKNLQTLGLYHDKIDGMLGLKSLQAIREFQRSNNIAADAYPSPRLISKINKAVEKKR